MRTLQITALTALAIATVNARAEDNVNSLTGVKCVTVALSVSDDETALLRKVGVDEFELQTLVELKLRTTGIYSETIPVTSCWNFGSPY